MIASFETLLPIFLLIVLGLALRAKDIVPEEMWRGLELLSYWVFFPALLTDTLARSNISNLPLTAVAATMIASFFTMAIGLLIARNFIMRSMALSGPSYSSVFQSATRWNGFIALPILAKLYGDEGVALVAIIIGALIPVANIMAVTVVARNADSRRLSPREVAYVVLRNPFVWSTALGLFINFLNIPIYAPIMTSLSLLGNAAIGPGLLMVGAGLSIIDARRPSGAVWLGTILKLVGTPILVTVWSFLTGVEGTAYVACMISAAVPTAMSAYVLARQMGGDAPLVASTLTVQTALSFLTIPLVMMVAEYLQ